MILSGLLSEPDVGLVVEEAFGIERQEVIASAKAHCRTARRQAKRRALHKEMSEAGWSITDDDRRTSGRTYE